MERAELEAPWDLSRVSSLLLSRLLLYALDMAVFVPLFMVYFLLRGLPPDRVATATANARRIIDIEQWLGIFREAAWQDAMLDSPALVDAANFTYLDLHMPLLVVMGYFYILADPRKHRLIRNTILLSAFAAVPIYQLFPVTPPRLLASAGYAGFGFVDTIPPEVRTKPGALANWYAAVPSYHFGWIALGAAGVWWCWRAWTLRMAAVVFAAWMWWAIVVTANHYFLDMVAGAAMVAVCFRLALGFERWAEAHPERVARFTVRAGPVRLPF